jgi:hypothetical protein
MAVITPLMLLEYALLQVVPPEVKYERTCAL